jgi:molybdate transport system substrate-binding protein
MIVIRGSSRVLWGSRYGGPLGAVFVSLLLGCHAQAPKDGKLLLFCGAGIRPPVAELAEEFGRRHNIVVECDYAGSEVLLSRIKLTRQGDLYMPGDLHYVELAEQEGLIASKQNVCYFVPVILVQKGNPKDIRTLSDLTRPELRVGLGDPKACAVGRTCTEIFQKNGIPEEQIAVAFRSVTVNELGNQVKLGALDAAIVWDAVAAFYPDQTQSVPIPAEQNVISTVPIGVLRSSKHPELAQAFVEFITSQQGREVFAKHHYSTTLPK